MTKGEQAGWFALAYLSIALFATWFTVICIVGWHLKKWFL
jgi:hypothetical protein